MMNEQQLMTVREEQPYLLLVGWRFGSNKAPRCHRTRNNRAVADLPRFTAWDSAAIAQRHLSACIAQAEETLSNLARKVWAMPKKKETSSGSEPALQTAGEVAE